MALRFGHVNPNKFLFGHFLFGCVWLAFIGGMASLALSVILRSNLKEYDSTTCRIERADVRQTSIDSFIFTAEFTYEYGGKTIKATSLGRPNQQEFEFSRLEARLPLLEKYAPGTVHVCRVNRENPSDGVLPVENPVPELGGIWQVSVIACICIVVTIFLSVGLGMIAFAFPGLRRKVTKAVKKRLGGAFAMLFALPFGIIGIGIITSTILTQKEASGFIPVQAKILYSGVASHRSTGSRGHNSTTYSTLVGYSYEVSGRTYESDRYSAGPSVSTGNYDQQKRKADTYKAGSEVTAYVSPRDPRKSFLTMPEKGANIALLLGMCAFAFAGIGFFIGGAWLFLSTFGSDDRASSFVNHVLRRSHADILQIGAFAILWNLIAWALSVAFTYDEPISQWGPVQYFVFIFPAVGLVLATVFVCKLIRELRAPKLTMSLSCAVWQPGSTAQVECRMDRPETVEKLEVALEIAEPRAYYKNTDRHVVSRTPCCSLKAPTVPAAWHFSFIVPAVDAEKEQSCAFAVKVRSSNSRKPYKLRYSLHQ